MALAGFIFTLIGWVFQFYETVIKKTRNINIFLPLAFLISCVLFAINEFITGDIIYAILDVVCVIVAAIIFTVLVTRKKLLE